jgi:cytochrome c oxidase subunit 2
MERRDFTVAAAIWLVVTLISFALIAVFMDPFPTKGSEEAEFVDEAFTIMSFMAAPVFGFVIAALGYSLLRFRASGTPTEDGPPVHGRGWVPKAWLGVTTALAAVVMVYPGLTGLVEIRGEDDFDYEIDVIAFQWSWIATYGDTGVRVSATTDELMLPAESRIRFSLTSQDVLHSLWIPALGPKIDAVPGLTTELFITTTEPGSPETDLAGYRLQCAELCGLQHTEMVMPVRVLEREEFDAWLDGQQIAVDATPAGETLPVALNEWAVEPASGSVEAGTVTFAVTNDGAVPHEFVVVRTDLAADELPVEGGRVDESGLDVVGRTQQLLGDETENLTVDLQAGSYVLLCNIPAHYDLGMTVGFTVQ